MNCLLSNSFTELLLSNIGEFMKITDSSDLVLADFEGKASLSLRAGRIIPILILALTIILAIFIFLDDSDQRKIIKSNIRAENTLKMESTLEHVEEYLGGVYSDILYISFDDHIKKMEKGSEEFIRSLVDHQKYRNRISEIYISKKSFKEDECPFLIFKNRLSEGKPLISKKAFDEREEYQVIYRQIQKFDKDPNLTALISEEIKLSYEDEENNSISGVVYSVPVKKTGELTGIVSAIIPTERISAELERGNYANMALLISDDGRIIGCKDLPVSTKKWFNDRLSKMSADEFFENNPKLCKVDNWTSMWIDADIASDQKWRLVFQYDENLYLKRSGVRLSLWRNLDIIGILFGGIFLTLFSHQTFNRYRERFKYLKERQITNEALNLSEAKYRDIVESTTDWIWTIDIEGNHTYSNDALKLLLGYDVEEIVGKSAFPLIHPDDQNTAKKAVEQAFKNRKGWDNLILRWIHKDGSIRYFASKSQPIIDSKGELTGFTGIDHDVTERQLAMIALTDSEKKYRYLIETTDTGYLIVDEIGKVIDANKEYVRLTGHSELADIMGRSVVEWTADYDKERNAQEVMKCMEQGFVNNLEIDYVDEDGKITPIDINARVMKTDDGLQILALCRDITERVRVEEEVYKLAVVVKHSKELVNLATLDGKMIFLNEAGGKILGIDPNEVENVNIMSVIPDHLKDLVQGELLPTLFESGIWEGELQYLNLKTGELTDMHAMTFTVQDPTTNEPLYLANVSFDLTEIKKAEKASVESAQQLKESQRVAHLGTYILDFKTGLWQSSDILNEIFGIDDDFSRNVEGWGEIVHPDFRKEMQNYLQNHVIAKKLPFDKEYKIVRINDNQTRWVHRLGKLVFDKEGNLEKMIGTIQDITDRKNTENMRDAVYRISHVVDSSETLDDLYKGVHEIIQSVMPADNFYIALYDEVEDMLSFSYFVDEMEPPPEPYKPRKGMTEYVLRSGKSLFAPKVIYDELVKKGEVEYIGPPGPIWLGVPLKIENQVIGVMVVQHYSDPDAYNKYNLEMLEFVSFEVAKAIDRKRSQDALKISEELNSGIVSNTPVGILYLDKDGKILFENPAMAKMMGVPDGEKSPVVGLNILEMPNIIEAGGRELIQRVLGGETITAFEMNYKTLYGTNILIKVHAAPRKGFDNDIIGAVIMCEDITGYQQLEAQLQQAQKMEAIGKLAGGVAHDFNNLLTVISGNVELLKMQMERDGSEYVEIDEISAAAERAADLTRQLLAFSRKQTLEPKILDLNIVIENMRKMLGRIIGEDISLVTHTAPDIYKVKADPGQIEQVITNLAVNSRDAMPEGGKLTIETANVDIDDEYVKIHAGSQKGSFVMLAISDSGEGIPDDVKEHIFDPFFTTKEIGKGTGLGLSTVYGIIKQSGGNIWVYSESGQGTCFKIYLPAVQGEADDLSPRKAYHELPTGHETILIVEDEESVRRLTVKVLEQQGYKVIEANGGNEALKICADLEKPVDLVVTDVVMPSMGGAELIRMLKDIWDDFKVLYMSGYTANAIVHQGVLDSDVPYLQKPFSPNVIVIKVREILDS